MTFSARFPGTCKVCRAPYGKGAALGVMRERGPRGGKQWAHAACCAREGQSPPVGSAPDAPRPARYVGGTCEELSLADMIAATPDTTNGRRHDMPVRFAPSWGDSVRMVERGDTTAETQAAIARGRVLGAEIAAASASSVWERDFCGAVPSVPHYLAGDPCAMRRRVSTASESAPIRVWLCLATSGSTPQAMAMERAGILAGFCEILAQSRAVDLRLYDITGPGAEGARPTHTYAFSPATGTCDSSLLAAAVGPAALRGIFLRYWQWRFPGADTTIWRCRSIMEPGPGMAEWIEAAREALGAGPDDVIVPPMIGTRTHTGAEAALRAALARLDRDC